MKRRLLLGLLGLAMAGSGGGAFAQAASGKPIRLVVTLPPGSSIDYVARLIAPQFGAAMGQTIVVDNKVGANGVIGLQDVMRAQPDGNTLFMGSLSPLAINVALVKNLPYDPRKDVTPLAGVYTANHVLVVKSDSPIKTFADFVANAKQHPGRVSVGHSTSMVQIQIATLSRLAGIDLLAVPYKGTPPTITDVIGGTLDATLLDLGSALGQVKGGQMRPLAVTSLKRNPVTPDWPAVSESLPGFDFPSWIAMVGPPGMAPDVVQKINAAMTKALNDKDVVDKLAQSGATPLFMTPDETRGYIASETAKWIKLAKDAGIQAE